MAESRIEQDCEKEKPSEDTGGIPAGGGNKTPSQNQKNEQNKNKVVNTDEFEKNNKRIPHEKTSDTNILGNITKLLPANTFLMFQTLAPLATNDGHCGEAEIIMTGVMLFVLAIACMLVSFTDTVQFKGKVYHGLVTRHGLWNPSFKNDPNFADLPKYDEVLQEYENQRRKHEIARQEDEILLDVEAPTMCKHLELEYPQIPVGRYLKGSTFSSGNSQYQIHSTDFLYAGLTATAFATLTMFTSPVSTCFYPNMPSTVLKTVPLLVGFVISAIFAFSPPARNGIAHPLPATATSPMDHYKPPDQKGVVHGSQLPSKPPGEKGDHGEAASADADLSEDIHISVALKDAAKSVTYRALVSALEKIGANPELARATVQDAKDVALTQLKKELQSAKSGLAGPSRQKSVATSEARDRAALVSTQVGSQPTVSAVTPQLVESLALGVAQGRAQAGSQPPAAIAIDIEPLHRPGNQTHAQLERQASPLSAEMQAPRTTMQRQMSLGKSQPPSAADTYMTFKQQASQLSPQQRALEFGVSQWMSTSPSSRPDDAGVTDEEVTAGQQRVDHVQRGASQLPRATKEIVTQAAIQAPTASQVQSTSSEIVTTTSQVVGHVAHPNATPMLRLDRPESTEITDSITTEEINSESESEPNNRGNFGVGSSNSFNLQGPLKRKL